MRNQGILFGIVIAVGLIWAASESIANTEEEVPHRPNIECRTFQRDLGDSVLQTRDQTTPVGQWIGEHPGWSVQSIDFEIGQKPTGYQQGWVHVCIEDAR